MTYRAPHRMAAECIGTALLVATVVGSGIMAETLAAGNLAVALLGNTIATGAMLFVLVTLFGPVSGAQFNPAVTAVFVLRRDMTGREGAGHVAMQLAGGITGTLLAHAMFGQPLMQMAAHVRSGPGQWLSEAVATFALVLTILGTIRHRPDAVAGTVALVIVAGYWFTASTSFANPAVTIARMLSDTFSGIAPADVPAFIASQLAGALIGAGAARGLGWWPESPAAR
jgi:glycerol uptake facilitator-like aquaporin